MINSQESTPTTSPAISPASTASTFVTAPINSTSPPTENPLKPVAPLASSAQGELAASLASSIATLSTAITTLAKERRTTTMMTTISSVSGTITSLAKVVETLGRFDVTTSPKRQPSHKASPDFQIMELQTAHSVKGDGKRRSHHRSSALGEKHRGATMQKPSPMDTRTQLAIRDQRIASLQKQNKILLKKTTLQKEFGDALLNNFEEMGYSVVRSHFHEMKELERELEGIICGLEKKNMSVVADNERLFEENMALKEDVKRLTSANQRLTFENNLRTDNLAEHQRGITEVERLSHQMNLVNTDKRNPQQKIPNLVKENVTLVDENQQIASKSFPYLDRERMSRKEAHDELVTKAKALQAGNKSLVDKIKQIKEERARLLFNCKRLAEENRYLQGGEDGLSEGSDSGSPADTGKDVVGRVSTSTSNQDPGIRRCGVLCAPPNSAA
ncbi:hypothetical protein CcaverHIS002_0407800 [Cutaneotrichosporon cavernicola]|uniref:Uncharacterized protein n=1 Tax=Cutaneotrichosporon cavernicola TaxID=279322 RepID=A0AA48L4U8_9TREE|nr:uncharacterized protein CcaverHIS019_0407780 [Cutaneotrichosporon cavernicola]BEI84176.1 hypothetical protein CcaverHIS002_0407800 [Cutaneotrichosporon cavernicola]BEI91958.1 hypothetical protein CcaverHIS019_0407780 [Cutaneotrichosporon cavernicola]BEI99729.1 hypothetical protein CcaverHIS631_0407720 [Cutaneotrichosporon cavernicola]BEJ07505.1 hypothetical protein CcaverHIS641_0407740 [Cutaneotrichosporon cavernicola]